MLNLDELRMSLDEETAGLDIAAVWLFGSEAAGKARRDSDVDIAILAAAPIDPMRLLALRANVGERLHRDVDIIDLRTASPILATQATGKGRLILDRRPADRHLFVASLFSRRYDLLRVRREAERALLRRLGVGR